MKPGLPKLLAISILGAAAAITPDVDVRDLPVTRHGSTLLLNDKPWKAVGANVYWLGLDENVIPPPGEPYYAPTKASYPDRGRVTEIMAVVKAMGGTMIRSHTLGVSTGNPLSVMPTAGHVNPRAFDAVDWAVWQARQYGLRLMVPLTDNFDYYHGGKYDFLRWGGFNLTRARDEKNPAVQNFYTNPAIVDIFKEYIRILLTHRNPLTNLTYAEDPTIFAYETGNELCGPQWKDKDVPVEWIREIGQFVKQLAPQKLLVDGTYGVNKSHLAIDEVDIYSNHYYPISINVLKEDVALVGSANKTYFAGEYAWNAATTAGDNNLVSWFREIEKSSVISGDAFWSLFGHDVPDCDKFVDHDDGLTMQYGNPAQATQIKVVRQHFLQMSKGLSIGADAELPSVPCVAALAPPPET
ncbi:glycoside hydrolase family 5 protein [Echria macrotheca]|uniref:mannan endo-1,4-beta-mannosidase n=1 Tax=Echria macrotheca TaxID=438768 RepID=A0AAJ0B998_9PEZI|nr:glycoside hydrolase family 5 protein [Echria macrotheca]